MKSKHHNTSACALLALVIASVLSITSAQSATVFGNGDLGSVAFTNGVTFGATRAWAVPFTTGGTTGDLLQLTGASVLVGDNFNPSQYSVRILADAGTNDGPTGGNLANSGNITVNPSAGVSWLTTDFISPVTLTTNTNYYFVVAEIDADTGFTWGVPQAAADQIYSDQGSGSSYAITPKISASQNLWRLQEATLAWEASLTPVSGTALGFQLTAVPEPSAVALLGLSGLALLRRRR